MTVAAGTAERINETLGEALASAEVETLEAYRVDGQTPEAVMHPRTAEQVAALLALAGEQGWGVIPWGSGGGMEAGHPPLRYNVALATSRLAALVDVDAGNLTVTAQSGMRIGELNRMLQPSGLRLPLILAGGGATPAGEGTLGGAIARNRAVPKRLIHGELGELLVGLRVALPDGSLARYGREAAGNPASYGMTKLFVGTHGMLGVIVEATFRVLPLPGAEAYLAAGYSSIQGAARAAAALSLAAMSVAATSLAASPVGASSDSAPSAAASSVGASPVAASSVGASSVEALHPASLTLLLGGTVRAFQEAPGTAMPKGRALLLCGFEGESAEVTRQIAAGGRLLLEHDATAVAELEALPAPLVAILERPAATLPQPAAGVRLGVAPHEVADAVARAVGTLTLPGMEVAVVADYPAGEISVELSGSDTDMWERLARRLAELRRGLAGQGGTAVLCSGPPELKNLTAVWGDRGGAEMPLQRLRREFDPSGVMAPGRFLPPVKQ